MALSSKESAISSLSVSGIQYREEPLSSVVVVVHISQPAVGIQHGRTATDIQSESVSHLPTLPFLRTTDSQNDLPPFTTASSGDSVSPKVSQRRAQPCAAVRRRIDTASSRAMSFSMRLLALGDRTRALAARRKSCQVAQNQTWAASIGADVTDDAWEGLQTPRLVLPYKSYMWRCSSTSSHPYIICLTPHTCHVTGAQ